MLTRRHKNHQLFSSADVVRPGIEPGPPAQSATNATAAPKVRTLAAGANIHHTINTIDQQCAALLGKKGALYLIAKVKEEPATDKKNPDMHQ